MFLVLEPVFLHFIRPEYLQKNQGTSWETYYPWKSENWIFRFFEIPETLGVHFLHFWNSEFLFFDNWKWWILENDEKSKTRNLLTLILPAEFLEKFGSEFSFDQKTWIDVVVKRTNCSIFGQCNPNFSYDWGPLRNLNLKRAVSAFLEPFLGEILLHK